MEAGLNLPAPRVALVSTRIVSDLLLTLAPEYRVVEGLTDDPKFTAVRFDRVSYPYDVPCRWPFA